MSLSVGGLMSGLDTESIITQLVEIERTPIVLLQRKEADYQLQLSTYGSLQNLLGDLESSFSALDKADDFSKFKATSDNTEIFTASADSDAASGSYNITVHNLAQGQKLSSTGFGGSESVGEGTLTIQVGSGTVMTVDVASGDTIQDVADAINDEEGDVTASVIFDGTDYFLSLTSSKTGAANVIKITVDDTGDSNHTDTNGLSRLAYEKGVTENLSESQEALDATIDVDGVTGIKRSSNTLDDVITGVTIDLVKAHDTPASESTQLTVNRDTAAIVSAIDDFVSAYNSVVDFLNTNQNYNEETGTGGALLGDATAKLIERRFRSVLNTDHPGMDTISMLADLGISRDDDGQLQKTTSTLTEALEENFTDVVQFFTQDTTGKEGFSVRMLNELDTMLDSYEGTLSARQDGIQRSIDDIYDDVDRIELRAIAMESRLRAQFNSLELLLSNYQATGNYLTQQISGLQNLSSAIAKK